MERYRNLEVWQLADALALEVYRAFAFKLCEPFLREIAEPQRNGEKVPQLSEGAQGNVKEPGQLIVSPAWNIPLQYS